MNLVSFRTVAILLIGVALLAPATPARADDAPAPTPDSYPAVAPPAESAATPTSALSPSPAPARRSLPLRPGDHGRLVATVQDRLAWLGHTITKTERTTKAAGPSTVGAITAFQEKSRLPATGVVTERTWRWLTEMSGPIGVLPSQCTQVSRSLCADKTSQLVRYLVHGKVKLTLDARFGLPGMDTSEGTFAVTRKSRDHVSSRYRTWMPFAMFFHGGEAIHYSPYFARDGYNGGSRGCVGIRDIAAAEWLYDHVPVGTRVHVYRS